MTTPEKAVDTVFLRHGWKSTETMPIQTAMARAWFAELEDLPDENYPFDNINNEMELTVREKINAAIWVFAAGGFTGLAFIGAFTVVRWFLR